MKYFEALIENTKEMKTVLFKSMYKMGSLRNRSDMRFEMRAEGLLPDSWHVIKIKESVDEGDSGLLGFKGQGFPEEPGEK